MIDGSLGEGGAVLTDDSVLAERVRMLRDHGSSRKYEHRFPGFNFRMEGVQGGMLAVKLGYLDSWNERRRTRAAKYRELLSDSGLVLPTEMPYARHVYHLYVVQAEDREFLREQLTKLGIETGLHYPIPLHLQEAYASLGYRPGDFPVAERLARRILSFPMHPYLTDEEIEYVASAILESLECRVPNQARLAS
jgi:dTDP-4-amino-4,6-dideoxygalactose transaminase